MERPSKLTLHEGAEFSHQHGKAKLIGAWCQAQTQYEVKTAADAAAKPHGEPVTMLAMDWKSLMEKFRQTFGPDLCENELPAQSYHEEFEESLAEGSLEAEKLRDVVSEEAQDQRKLKADPARQYGMHLDGKLALQTQRKFTSVEPANQEELRTKYTVLQNMWLLAQLRKPARSIYKDLTQSTFEDHLKLLLNRRNFNYRKEVEGQLMSQPCWSHCLSYEYELRKRRAQEVSCTSHPHGCCVTRLIFRCGLQVAALGSVDCDREFSGCERRKNRKASKKRLRNSGQQGQRSRFQRMRPRQRALPQS